MILVTQVAQVIVINHLQRRENWTNMTEDQDRSKMILQNHPIQAAAVHQVQAVKVVQIPQIMTLITNQRKV